MIYPLILSGILLYISGGAGVNTQKLNIAVKSGSSGIMPCVYDKQYKENRKYLCWGRYWSSCHILTDANKKGKYSITDYPDQSIFTVHWDKLQTSDYGYYWCAVEIGDYGTTDAGYYWYLTVQSAPDVSVVSSSVSGHEGGNVSVQCFYSSKYQKKLKQWCRYKDQGCYTEKRTDTSQNPSVQISDDGRSSFTVLMTGLRLSDSGWYWCSAGDLQVPVQLMVNEPKHAVTNVPTATPSDAETDMLTTPTSAEDFNRNLTTVTNVPTATPSDAETDMLTTQTSAEDFNRNPTTVTITDLRSETHIDETNPSLTETSGTIKAETHSKDEQNKAVRHVKHDVTLLVFLVATLVLSLLLSLVVIVTWRLGKKPERGHIGEEEHINTTSNTTSSENQMTSSSPAAATSSASVDDASVIYSSVIFQKAGSSSVDPEGDVIYSSVKKTCKPTHS